MTKLYRSETDKIIGGVCGGLGEYLGIDSTVVRLVFVLLGLASGSGLLMYFILWIIMPTETTIDWEASEVAKEGVKEVKKNVKNAVKAVKKDVKSDTKKK
jgi:phage shock protein PspC (stress-responsive transcriptional regulator)